MGFHPRSPCIAMSRDTAVRRRSLDAHCEWRSTIWQSLEANCRGSVDRSRVAPESLPARDDEARVTIPLVGKIDVLFPSSAPDARLQLKSTLSHGGSRQHQPVTS